MTRLTKTAAALLALTIAVSGCSTSRRAPSMALAPAMMTNIGVNSYLWRAAVDTVSFAPLLQADANSGVIITDWYVNPRTPNERVKLTVSILDRELRADALRVIGRPPAAARRHMGRCAGRRGDGAEARGHHPDPGARYPPHDRRGLIFLP